MKKRDFEKQNADVISMEQAIKEIAKAGRMSRREATKVFIEAIRSGKLEAMTVDPATAKRTPIPSVQ